MKTLELLLFFSLFSINLFAQNSPKLSTSTSDTLSLEKALTLALENSHQVKISKNLELLNRNNMTKGNAGSSPTVSLVGGGSYSNDNTKFAFATGETQVQNGAASNAQNASLNISYRLYGGGLARSTYKRFQVLLDQSSLQTRQSLEAISFEVINAYYEVARQAESYHIAQEALETSKDRLARVRGKNEFGTSNKLNVLNARVDLNADSVALLTAETDYENAKRSLNQLLLRDLESDFAVERKVDFNKNLNLEQLLNEASTRNAEIRLARYDENIAEIDAQIAESGRMPVVDLIGDYGFNRNQSEAGFVLVNQSFGFTGGINFSFNITDGKQRSIQIQNAKIGIENSREQILQAQEVLEKDLTNAYYTFQNALRIIDMQKRNLDIVRENFEISLERFNFGQLTTTQFREAQLNLVRAENTLINATFTAKLAEVNLLRLAGLLVE